MFLDKETVMSLLDKKSTSYDGNLIAIKLLPNEAIFEIVIEEIVTAEYFDIGKNEFFIFDLSHDYFSFGKDIPESHIRSLDLDILKNLKEEKENSNNVRYGTSDKIVIISASILIILFLSILLIIVFLKFV